MPHYTCGKPDRRAPQIIAATRSSTDLAGLEKPTGPWVGKGAWNDLRMLYDLYLAQQPR